MSITSSIVLFAVIWFMVLFVVLPLRAKTQGDVGEIVPGTHAGAPVDPQLKRKAKIVTMWAFGIWILVAGTIYFELFTIEDFNWYGRYFSPETAG